MKLPNLPFLQKKGNLEYILVLLLRQEKANAVIIEKNNASLRVLNQHEEFFSTNLEDASNEEWLDILDTAISRAEETLPPNIETHQTVFGLPNSWVEDKQIKKEYLTKLKHASDELDLKPIGFIEIPEAIAYQIAETEGAPVSALITEIGKKHVVISLSRAGRIIETKSQTIQDSPVAAVDSLLKTFTDVDVLPSRLIVYNGSHAEELSQPFITHHWSKSIPFLHMPKVTILEKGFDVRAVVRGAAEQLGVSLVGKFGGQESPSITTLTTPHRMEKASGHEKEEMSLEDETEALPEVASAESLGFVIGKDINDLPPDEESEHSALESTPHKIHTQLQSDNVKEISEGAQDDSEPERDTEDGEPHYVTHNKAREEHENIREPEFLTNDEQKEIGEERKRGTFGFPFPKLPFPHTLPSLAGMIPGNSRLHSKFVLLLPLLLIILIVLAVLYTTFLRATIEVTVRPEVAKEEAEILFTTTGPSDFSENIIAAKTTNLKLSGSVSTDATGEKEIGEKAKGTVTIFNSASSKKELPEGTVITSSNNLDFVLDKSVIIASASGDIFTGIKSGTAKVPVTASDIGKESNIPSDTKFTVGSDSTLAARNDEAFSGGSKKEVTVVSKNDIAKLTKDLPNSLKKKAEDGLNEKLGKQEVLLTTSADFTPSDKEFSATEGEEADAVTLSAVVEFTGVFYDNTELIEFTKTLIKQEFSQDQTVDESGMRNTLTDIEEEDNEYKATLSVEANLLPKIDTQKLKEEFKGKSFDEVNRKFDRLPQVINTRISLFPPIPFLPQMMPRRSENIEIIVTSNE